MGRLTLKGEAEEDIVDSVAVDAIIHNSGGSHLGAFPGSLLRANHQDFL